jgi:capsular polysaccharide transport system permease protein
MRGWFLLLVVLPTLAVGVYFYGFAANIYESEARFVVRTRGSGNANPMADIAGASRMASLFPAARTGSEEGRAVVAYVDSHAAVAALRGSLDLVDLWRRPEIDAISRLWWDQPQAEWLLWYYRRRVRMALDPDTGVMILRAQAFRPDDAQTLSRALLALSERLVNTLSERGSTDALRSGEEDLARAEARVAAARDALIAFREREQAFDPARAAAGAVETIGRLEGALAQARTELQERQTFMRPDNPQIQVLRNRIEALQAQIAAERGRMTRGGEAMTQQVAGFERLELERMLADRQLASATASLEAARTEAIRQQTFVLRVAEPHLPEAALYPRAAYNTLTVFVSLAMLFGVGWLLIVSAREHAN